jgi:transcriptional regulator with GAF, ATPase, and Fis domain
MFARAIHNLSSRRDGVIVKVNCAALPSGLIESELFGHEKGAFTGAVSRKLGRFELANSGTLFLDEIGDLPLDLQGKLLRVLQEGEFERLGGQQTLRVDVRVIAATSRDLDKALAEQTYRPDLYYRLNVFPIHLPPLRERPEDLPALVRYFVAKFSKKMGKRIESVSDATLAALENYPWPGNVRELENLIERAMIISSGPELDLGDGLPDTPKHHPEAKRQPSSLEEAERLHIRKALQLSGGKISGTGGAAAILNLKPTTLEAKMKKLGISRNDMLHQNNSLRDHDGG